MRIEFPALQPILWTDVAIQDDFWSKRCDTNRKATLLHGFKMLKEHGYEENFERAGERLSGGFQGLVYQDSDVYKLLQSVAASLAIHPDQELQKQFDKWVDLIEKAQEPDGYLNTCFQLKEPEKKWRNLRDWHELYCAGHLVEAGVTDFRATGRLKLLEICIRLADHIDGRFGPAKAPGYPGHPELELALIELFRATGEQKYYDLARHFVRSRGTHYFAREHDTPEAEYNGTYWQDRVPIADVDVIEGHAVRAAYLLCAATDVVAETKDTDLERMIRRVWDSATQRRMYVTGGIGNSSENEGFTGDYDLPNESAYQETCASIAMVFWSHRMALLYRNAKYVDIMERALYNGVLSGVSLDGEKFFYENPLASAGEHHRRDWYACACCPPNISRLLSSLGSYIYAKSDGAVWINLYVAGEVDFEIGDIACKLNVETNYPWSGKVTIIPGAGDYRVMLRIPSWCESYKLSSGSTQAVDGYAAVDGPWDGNKAITLDLDMPVRMVESHPSVEANRGLVAISRGPLIYCFEQVDQKADLNTIFIPSDTKFSLGKNNELGVATITAEVYSTSQPKWPGGLYSAVSPPKKVRIEAIPYGWWDNRSPGAMAVWMPTSAPPPPGD